MIVVTDEVLDMVSNLKGVYVSSLTWPKGPSLKKCFCFAVSFCSVIVILAGIIARIM